MAVHCTTKERIFLKSVALFAEHGYDNVSIRHIASAVGITVAAIYNHYEGKEEILTTIYDYYRAHCFDTRMDREQYMPILKTGNGADIINIFYYSWAEPAEVMMGVMRIVWARKLIDPGARSVYQDCIMKECFRYSMEVLEKGREIGRIRNDADDLETLTMAMLATRVFSASAVILDSDEKKWTMYDVKMLELLADHLQLSDPIQD